MTGVKRAAKEASLTTESFMVFLVANRKRTELDKVLKIIQFLEGVGLFGQEKEKTHPIKRETLAVLIPDSILI